MLSMFELLLETIAGGATLDAEQIDVIKARYFTTRVFRLLEKTRVSGNPGAAIRRCRRAVWAL